MNVTSARYLHISKQNFERTQQLLVEHRPVLDQLAKQFLEIETLDGSKVKKVLVA